jgi:O-antigen ligase
MSIRGRVAGLAAIAALHAYWFLQPIPTTFKTLAAVLVVLSLLRPAWGLIAFAAIAPLSTVVANHFSGPVMGAQLLEQFALAISAGVLLRRSDDTPTRIGAPAAVVAAVSLASAAVIILSAIWFPIQDGRTPVVLAQFWNRQLAKTSPFWAPALVAMTAIACAALAWAAERTVRQQPQLASHLLMTALAGHAAAALLGLNAIREMAVQAGSFWANFPVIFRTIRISVQIPGDVHAAASALLLAGIAGLGLLKNRSWIWRAVVGLLLLLIATGLWTTGSRVAILLAGLSVMVAMGWWAARRSWRHLAVTTGAIAVVSVGVWFALLAPSRFSTTAYSFNARFVMMKAGMQMFVTAPAFGIGITRFYAESAAVVGPDIIKLVSSPRENAHNNFIQVLAEQGVVGLAAMLWWLAVMVVGGARAQIAKPDAQRGALLLAVVACACTWLVGHPLLVPEFALVFWMYGGVLVAMTPSQSTGRRVWLVAALIAALFLTVPFRAMGIRNAAYLEHYGVGVSVWHPDDTQRYREAGAAFSLYLPSGGDPTILPIRRAPDASGPLVIEVGIGGRHLTTLTVDDDNWHETTIAVPASARLFELVDFSVRQPAANAAMPKVLLRIGREAAR